MSTTTQPVKHHTAADLAKFEKQMKREETMDANNLKTAQKELAHAEKAVRKSEKVLTSFLLPCRRVADEPDFDI